METEILEKKMEMANKINGEFNNNLDFKEKIQAETIKMLLN